MHITIEAGKNKEIFYFVINDNENDDFFHSKYKIDQDIGSSSFFNLFLLLLLFFIYFPLAVFPSIILIRLIFIFNLRIIILTFEIIC